MRITIGMGVLLCLIAAVATYESIDRYSDRPAIEKRRPIEVDIVVEPTLVPPPHNSLPQTVTL